MADNAADRPERFEALFNKRDYAAAQAPNPNGVADPRRPESAISPFHLTIWAE